jgi:hypothetical protein
MSLLLCTSRVGAAETAGDKATAAAAAPLGSIGRPHLLDGMLPSVMEAAREWVMGDKAYVGMLAGKDGECLFVVVCFCSGRLEVDGHAAPRFLCFLCFFLRSSCSFN